jgi:hypothetical protein
LHKIVQSVVFWDILLPSIALALATLGQAGIGEEMSTLDDIAKERQLLADRLAKIDGERAKMAEQLAELEAAERVLSRFTKTRPQLARRGRRAAAAEAKTKTAAAAPRRGRRGRRAVPKSARVSLGDATLRAVAAHGHGASVEEVRKFLADQLGMQVRPNHLGMALHRHRRAGRLEQRDLRWHPPQSPGAEATPS